MARSNTGVPFLYKDKNGYIFQNRFTGKRERLGKDLAKAVTRARKKNRDFERAQEEKEEQEFLQELISTPEESEKSLPVHHLYDRYKKERVAEKGWKPQTLKNNLAAINKSERTLGSIPLKKLSTKHVADYLDGLTANAYIKHRSTLMDVFKFAKAKGLIDHNPVADTLTKLPPKKERERLSLQEYVQIFDHASPWLKTCMGIILRTFLRPIDVVNLRFEDIHDSLCEDDSVLRTLYTATRKTETYKEPIYLAIEIDAALQKIIDEAANSGVSSPYIVHKPVERKGTSKADHPTFYNQKRISREFTALRDELEIQSELAPKKRATLYEIRALGSWLAKKHGADQKEVVALMGHTSEKMTEHYQGGHEIEYKSVRPLLPENLTAL